MDRKKTTDGLERLERWCSGKPVLLAWFAPQVAMGLEDCYEIAKSLQQNPVALGPVGQRQRNEWLSFYSRKGKLRRCLMEAAGLDQEERFGLEYFFRGLWRAEIENSSFTKAEFEEGLTQGRDLWRSLLDAQWSEFAGGVEEPSGDELNEFFAALAPQFFFGVGVPCWILHGKWPSEMFETACAGTTEGLKNLVHLIRIDRHVIHHPKLARVLHPIERHLRKSRADLLRKGLDGRVPPISLGRCRYRLSRLIFDVAERIDFPLKTPQVQELFEITAEIENSRAILRLPKPTPETYYQGLKRENGFWDLPPKPDKKSLKVVRELRAALS